MYVNAKSSLHKKLFKHSKILIYTKVKCKNYKTYKNIKAKNNSISFHLYHKILGNRQSFTNGIFLNLAHFVISFDISSIIVSYLIFLPVSKSFETNFSNTLLIHFKKN